MLKVLTWLLKLPFLAGYRSYIGLGILGCTGLVIGLQAVVGFLAGSDAAVLVGSIPILAQVVGWQDELIAAGTWLTLVGAAFNNESPRMLLKI